jgi:hypothetical protein
MTYKERDGMERCRETARKEEESDSGVCVCVCVERGREGGREGERESAREREKERERFTFAKTEAPKGMSLGLREPV